jgi:flavin reductase (DIM6/NTAB) family NADH-FMN oxidoreductase RutF
MHELLRSAGGFAVSLLSAEQDAVAQHFARGVPPFAHWHGIATRPGAAGAPLLDGALGWLECRTAGEHPAGDHTFFVGEVLSAERGEAAAPLVYLDRRYVPLDV